MPRPVKDDPRDHFQTFRFTAGEITHLRTQAKASGLSLSEYVRGVALNGHGSDGEAGKTALEQGARPAANGRGRRHDFALQALAEQMRKVGVNLNQIAHRMNEQRIPPPRELTLLIDEIRAYVRQVREP